MKKKLLFIILIPVFVLILAFGISGVIFSRANSEGFVISDGVLTMYNGSSSEVIIPSEVEIIGPEAFSGNPLIEKVIISNNVKEIDRSAFSKCLNLKEVSVSDTVESIGDSAFSDCSSLSIINFGRELKNLGSGVFSGCSSLNTINNGSDSFIVRDGCIYDKNCEILYQYLPGYYSNIYSMPETVKDIKRYAFWGANNLEVIECSALLDKINDYAFSNAANLKNVIIYAPVNKIGIGAFEACTSLKQVECPVSIVNIDDTAFNGDIKDIIFVCEPGSYVNNFAIEHGYLTSTYSQISIEQNEPPIIEASLSDNSVLGNDHIDSFIALNQSIEEGLYSYSDNLPGETTEGNVISDTRIVSDQVFISTNGLDVIDGSNYTNSDVLIVDNYSHYMDTINEYEFDENVQGIGKLAFARSALTSITIPEGITTIGYGAFYHCDNLTEVNIPSSVICVEEYAFNHTPWYEEWLNDPNSSDFLIVGNGVLIGYKGEENNPQIPDEVKYISDGVF